MGGVEPGQTGKLKKLRGDCVVFVVHKKRQGTSRTLGLPTLSVWKLGGPEELPLDSKNF